MRLVALWEHYESSRQIYRDSVGLPHVALEEERRCSLSRGVQKSLEFLQKTVGQRENLWAPEGPATGLLCPVFREQVAETPRTLMMAMAMVFHQIRVVGVGPELADETRELVLQVLHSDCSVVARSELFETLAELSTSGSELAHTPEEAHGQFTRNLRRRIEPLRALNLQVPDSAQLEEAREAARRQGMRRWKRGLILWNGRLRTPL